MEEGASLCEQLLEQSLLEGKESKNFKEDGQHTALSAAGCQG